jgi:anaerobic selenocysteine-containing dehydrogenase
LRAVVVSACNPLRSYADTIAYEEAFKRLDLLVVNDIVMSETARLAHYVLPCRSFFESWDGTFFPLSYPGVFFQMRRPIVAPPAQCLEAAQIHTMLADRLGLIPEIPNDLVAAAKGDRLAFGIKLMEWAATEPRAQPNMPFILAKTLGEVWDSAALASLWGMMVTAPKLLKEHMARAGFEPGLDQGDRVFQAILDNPKGLWIGRADENNNFSQVRTASGKIEVFIPELEAEASNLNPSPEAENLKMPTEYPLILNVGRHMDYNANTLMRNPDWNKNKRACTVAVSPVDAKAMGLVDGQQVKVETEASNEMGELQVTDQVRVGMVLIPHGFGLINEEDVYGINVNRLTKNTHRDPLGTPIHRFIPCRVEAV